MACSLLLFNVMEVIHLIEAVHLDWDSTVNKNPRDSHLKPSWDRYVESIAPKADSVLVYFSAYPANPWHSDEGDNFPIDAVKREINRREYYYELLGGRFIFFPVSDIPRLDIQDLRNQFIMRDFTLNPRNLNLVAFGEYKEYCVEAWMRETQRSLELDNANCRIEHSLSLSYHQARTPQSPL